MLELPKLKIKVVLSWKFFFAKHLSCISYFMKTFTSGYYKDLANIMYCLLLKLPKTNWNLIQSKTYTFHSELIHWLDMINKTCLRIQKLDFYVATLLVKIRSNFWISFHAQREYLSSQPICIGLIFTLEFQRQKSRQSFHWILMQKEC